MRSRGIPVELDKYTAEELLEMIPLAATYVEEEDLRLALIATGYWQERKKREAEGKHISPA